MSNGVVKIVVAVIAAAVGFAAVQYGLQKYQERRAVSAVDDKLQQLKAEAAKDNPNGPTSEGIREAAMRDAAKSINNAPDEQSKRSTAAGTFFGFYLINARSRPEFCQEQGVDIHAFTDPFVSNHAKLLEVSRPILASSGYDEDKLYGMLKPQLRSMLEIDMKDIANSAHTNAKGACELLAARGADLAGNMQFAKTQPAIYQVLMPGG